MFHLIQIKYLLFNVQFDVSFNNMNYRIYINRNIEKVKTEIYNFIYNIKDNI